jgi:hypothetical protein
MNGQNLKAIIKDFQTSLKRINFPVDVSSIKFETLNEPIVFDSFIQLLRSAIPKSLSLAMG